VFRQNKPKIWRGKERGNGECRGGTKERMDQSLNRSTVKPRKKKEVVRIAKNLIGKKQNLDVASD